MKQTRTNGSATMGSTEYSIAAVSTTLAAQTDSCDLEVWFDLSAMTATEQFRIRLYEKINGGSQVVVYEAYVSGIQPGPFVTPRRLLGEGWDCTIKKIAGTDRAIPWSLRKLVEGETIVIASGGITNAKFATDAIDANALKADAATEIATAVGAPSAGTIASAVADVALASHTTAGSLAKAITDLPTAAAIVTAVLAGVVDGSRTVKGILGRLNALTIGKLTGLKGATVTAYKADGTTKSFEMAQDTTAGTRDAATTAVGD